GKITRWDVGDPAHPARIGAAFVYPGLRSSDPIVGSMSPDGRLLAAGAFTAQHTTVWDVASHRVRYQLPGAAGRFSPDGTLFTTTTGDRIRFWDAATGAPAGASIGGFGIAGPSPIFSRDGRLLAAADLGDNSIRLFDVSTRRPIGAPRVLHR